MKLRLFFCAGSGYGSEGISASAEATEGAEPHMLRQRAKAATDSISNLSAAV